MHILDQFLNICKQNKEGVVTTHTLFMYIKHNVDSLHALFLELYFSCVIVGTILLPSKVHVVQV